MAERRLLSRFAVTWRYLPSRRVKHALPVESRSVAGHDVVALCGVQPPWRDWEWLGTGSQAEYETVRRLPECSRCTARVAPEEEVPGG